MKQNNKGAFLAILFIIILLLGLILYRIDFSEAKSNKNNTNIFNNKILKQYIKKQTPPKKNRNVNFKKYRYYLYDSNGKQVTKEGYDKIDLTNWDCFIVKNANRVGLLSDTGKIIIPSKYLYIKQVHNQPLFIARDIKNKFHILIDTEGRELLKADLIQVFFT